MINKYKTYVIGLGGSSEVVYWVEHNLLNYLNKHKEDQVEIEHILDFLISDKSPARLKKMSYKEAKESSEKWVKSLTKKGNNIVETEEDYKVVVKFKDGMQWVKLKSESAYKREGHLMSHCVASYYGRKGAKIYSLRDVNNQPHCTVEVVKDGGEIQQIKGKGNGSIHPKYIKHVLRICKKLGKEIRSSELKYLGYEDVENVTPGATEWIKKNVSAAEFMSFKGKEYLFTESIKKHRAK